MSSLVCLSPRRVSAALALIVVGLTLISIIGLLAGGRFLIFNVNGERNIPAWFSTGMLLSCSALLALIACVKKARSDRHVLLWQLLALTFLFLSVDEAASIHERLNKLGSILPDNPLLYFAWVAPALVFVVIYGVLNLRLLADLPVRIRILFLVAGGIYVGGALGVEMIAGYYLSFRHRHDLAYSIITVFEETLEMCGAIVFIYALMTYINLDMNHIRIYFSDKTIPANLLEQQS